MLKLVIRIFPHVCNRAVFHTANHVGPAITILGLSIVLGCAQPPIEGDPEVAPGSPSTVTYARAAVEVGTIQIAQMPEFEASVERMSAGERIALWSTLKELHDRVHPSPGVEHDATPRSAATPIGEAGCYVSACSHSDRSSETAQWCCALGEDYMFYMNDGAQE